MARRTDHLNYAINLSKYMAKKAKSDVERRRMFDRFCVLAKLYPDKLIQLVDDAPVGRTPDAAIIKSPTLDEQAQEMLKRLKGGVDVDANARTTD
jgi:hypothetical protein